MSQGNYNTNTSYTGGYGYGGDSYTTNTDANRTSTAGRYGGYYQDTSATNYGVSNYASGPASGGTGTGAGGANFDKLQEQLNLRESQLAMASNLLEQQSRLIADVSLRDERPVERFGGYRDRKRSGPEYHDDYKRRRFDDNDDRRDRRSGGYQSQQRFGSGGGRQYQHGRMGRQDRGGRGYGGRDYNVNRRGGRGSKQQRGQMGNRGGSHGQQMQKVKPVPYVDKDLSRHYCHVCEVECFNEKNYQNHMTGTRHKEKEVELEENPTKKAIVEEKIKKQQEEREKPAPEKVAVDHCDVCDLDIHVTLDNHLKFKQHRHRESQVKRGCSWCSVETFVNFSEVLAHRLTEMHKQMREQFGYKYRAEAIAKPEFLEPEDIPAFEADVSNGIDFVVNVTGYFCKLCNKFYKKEEAAKQTHCASETHYDKWKQAKLDSITEYHTKIAEQKEKEEIAKKKFEEAMKKREEEKALADEKSQEEKAETGEEAEQMETQETGDGKENGEMETETEKEQEQEQEQEQVETTEEGAEDVKPVEESISVEEEAQLLSKDDEADDWTGGSQEQDVGGEQKVKVEAEAEPEVMEEEEAQTPTKRTRATRGRGRGRGRK